MRPPSFSLHLTAILSLPYRLCNPPPAAGNVRSCKVTPLIKVSLDDVLNKRHLPPLTLKDFEEWLVFVEGCPQYLYFILWLKEYEARYTAWLAESGCASPSAPSTAASTTSLSPALSFINLIPASPPLALFFTRAKQTFLDPASPHALGPDALAALIAASAPSTHSLSPSIPAFTAPTDDSGLPPLLADHPHPHPKDLVPLASFCRAALKPRVARFAETACHNVGTRRAWCGVAGGSAIALIFGLAPTLVAMFCAHARWWRVVGWLGLWLGGTIIVSSFHGICMMIYIFGDLRQLRAFELARPPISPPRAIARARPRLRSLLSTSLSSHTPATSPTASSRPTPPQSRPRPRITIPAPVLKTKSHKQTWSATSTGTPVVHLRPGAFGVGVVSDASTDEVIVPSGSGEDDFGIDVSPAYYYSQEKADVAGVGSASRSGSRVGMVMQWVLGRGSGSGGEGERSHAGTFGVRSWSGRGGLGSLPEVGSVPEPELVDEKHGQGVGVDEKGGEAQGTAAFIPCAYEQDEGEEPFDFDKLPGLYAHPGARVVSPPLSPSPGPPLSPSPAPVEIEAEKDLETEKEKEKEQEKGRQWWDTCPRHPAVEALSSPSLADGIASSPSHPTAPSSPNPSHPRTLTPNAESPRPVPASSHPSPHATKPASSRSVPAFAPLTRVLSPLAARGQWEIVVRSACVAALGAWVLVGCFVAVPAR